MMMPRRGGKRIRMDDPVPMEFEEDMYRGGGGGSSDHLNESFSDQGEGESPVKGGRMTRQRARGGVRDRPPIIDEDDDDMFRAAPAIQPTRKRKAGRQAKPAAPKVAERVEKPIVERAAAVGPERDVTEDETSLYYIIKNTKSSIASIVDEWIESYKEDRDHALIVLMQLFINASGCKGRITPEISFLEHTAIIRKMTEEFDEESGEYPLIMPGQQWKKFKVNFCQFVETLVKQCQYSIIFDQFLMDHLISLLTGLSDSQVRAFRHTATLAAMKLMTALVDVALLVSVNFENAARQCESERLKTRDKRGNDRLESLLKKRTELEENMEEIKNMLTYMFKSVFVHRYRDTLPDIRGICMSEIGVWMLKLPNNFLDDSYLKYIGWTLHDKVGDVRLRCLQALLPLYASDELKGKMELFTSKFKDRIVAMALDKEFEVAVIAVRLVISILKIHPDILSDKDCEIVYELVYSSHRGVAQAAAEFLNVRLFHIDEDADVYRTNSGKTRLPNTPLVRDLVQFFIESELHEHGAYLVDSFIDNNPMVKDWECMTDLLIEDPGPSEEQLDDKQESALIEIMVSAIRQCSTGEPPVGRGNTRKMAQTSKEVKQVQEDKQTMTEHFIQVLPRLVQRYGADSEKLANLMAIPQYFDLVVYTNSRLENNLQIFLKQMADIMKRHNDRDVLETCSKTLEFLCSESSAIFTRCDNERSNIIEECVDLYKEKYEDWRNLIASEEVPEEDDVFHIVVSLKKLSILYACHNLNPGDNLNGWVLFNSLYEGLEDYETRTAEGKSLPNEAIVYCIESCYSAITWGLHFLENECEQHKQEETSTILQRNLFKFMTVCTELVQASKVLEIQEAAFKSICDLLIIFSDKLGAIHPTYKKLHYVSTAGQQAVLNGFVQQYVFATQEEESHDETRIEELHKKRNYLAAYCKLVVYNVIPTKSAADIFKHYLRCYNEYGDIIKATIGKAREMNKINCALTMCLSLITTYKEIQNANDSIYVSKNSQAFTDLKELAKRFALSFGLDAVKNREVIISLHRAGILFAVQNNSHAVNDPSAPPPSLLFLEILNEFTNKLLKQDKKVVLNFLDRRISSGIPSSRVEDWQPLINYRNSLMHGEADQAPVTSKRAYAKRRIGQDVIDEEDEDNYNSDAD